MLAVLVLSGGYAMHDGMAGHHGPAMMAGAGPSSATKVEEPKPTSL